MTTKTINSFQELVDEANSHCRHYLYRGETKVGRSLKPKIARDVNPPSNDDEIEEFYSRERRVFGRFRTSSIAAYEFTKPLETEWHWLTLAQHHGTPTRFVDWSENLLVAAYFATVRYPNENGVIYTVHPREKSFLPYIYDHQPLTTDLKTMFFFRPPYITQRLITQSSVFYTSNKPWVSIKDTGKWSVGELIISKAAKGEIKKILPRLGIRKHILMGDLDSLSEDIKEWDDFEHCQ